jgi:hypothetical protein
LAFDPDASITRHVPEAPGRTGVARTRAAHPRPHRGWRQAHPEREAPRARPAVGPLTVSVCAGCVPLGTDGLFGIDAEATMGLEIDVRRGKARVLDCR